MSEEIVSFREFARRLGVGEKTIRDGVKTGKIKKGVEYDDNGKPKLNYAIALQEAKDVGLGRKALGGEIKLKVPRKYSKPVDELNEPNDKQEDAQEGEILSYAQAIQKKENFLAKIKELEFKEKEGSLVSKEEVFKELFTFGQEMRDAFQVIPNQVAANIAAAGGNINKITTLLSTAIHDVLEKLSKIETQEL